MAGLYKVCASWSRVAMTNYGAVKYSTGFIAVFSEIPGNPFA